MCSMSGKVQNDTISSSKIVFLQKLPMNTQNAVLKNSPTILCRTAKNFPLNVKNNKTKTFFAINNVSLKLSQWLDRKQTWQPTTASRKFFEETRFFWCPNIEQSISNFLTKTCFLKMFTRTRKNQKQFFPENVPLVT